MSERTHLIDRQLAEARERNARRLMKTDEYKAGAEAFRAGVSAANCPYCFEKTVHYPKDTEGLERNFRYKLNQWMAGWIEAKKERGSKP